MSQDLVKKCQRQMRKLGISDEESLGVCSLVESTKQLDICLLAAEHLTKDDKELRAAKEVILSMTVHKYIVAFERPIMREEPSPREEKILYDLKKRIIVAKNVKEFEKAFESESLGIPQMRHIFASYGQNPNIAELSVKFLIYKSDKIEVFASTTIDMIKFQNNPGSKIIENIFKQPDW